MKEDLISVIVPVYNVEKYLNRCIESIINQTYKNLEIILVDDGSPDNCPQMCDAWAKKDNRIKVIHKENEGLGLTRNVGIEYAHGTYISFVDSDDYIDINMYATIIEEFKNQEIDAVLFDCKRILNNGKKDHNALKFINKTFENDQIVDQIIPSICGSKKFGFLVGSAWCNVYKKSILDEYIIRFKSEREIVSEDLAFNFNYYVNCKKVKMLKNDFYCYCENEASLTKKYNPDKKYKFIKLYQELEKKIKNEEVNKSECKDGIETLYVENMRVAIIQEVRLNPNKKEIKTNVKDICNNELLCEILKNYSAKYLSVKQKIFTYLMKKKMISILIFLTKI